MTRKQIDSMRETRLWIGQIVVPAVVLVAAMSPESRENVKKSAKDALEKIKRKLPFQKREP